MSISDQFISASISRVKRDARMVRSAIITASPDDERDGLMSATAGPHLESRQSTIGPIPGIPRGVANWLDDDGGKSATTSEGFLAGHRPSHR
jgi:hypothetical protein